MKLGVVTNPDVRFGKPVVAGTRITVEEVLGALEGGMDFEEIQKEYGLQKGQVLAAIRYVNAWIKGEEVRQYEVSARR